MQKPSKVLSKFSEKEQDLAGLISSISDRSESALSSFYDYTSRWVFGLALRILADVAEAEEVTLEVYMQVWDKAVDYDPKRSTPSAWLLMLTRSRAIDRLRSNAKRNNMEESLEIDPSNSIAEPEETILFVEKSRIIQNALSKLTPQQRKSIELAYFYGLTQTEISSRLGQPLGTVKSWIRLGMIKLREILGSFDEIR